MSRRQPRDDLAHMVTGMAWPSGSNVESVIDAYASVTGLSQLDLLERIVLLWREEERGGGRSGPNP